MKALARFLCSAGIFVCILATSTVAREGDYLRYFNPFGSQPFGPRDERVVFSVGSEREQQTTIALLAEGRGAEIRRITVVFASGERMEVRNTYTLRDSEATPPIDLKGGSRKIVSVVVELRSGPGRGQGRLELLASQTEIDEMRGFRGRESASRRFDDGDLGARRNRGDDDDSDGQRRGFFGEREGRGGLFVSRSRNKDILSNFNAFVTASVPRNAQRVRIDNDPGREPQTHITVRAIGRPIGIRDLIVTFGDGSEREFRVGEQLEAGEFLTPVWFDGARRKVVSVLVTLRDGSGGGQLELYGAQLERR